jgi:CRISPR-associated protein Csx16
MEKQMKTILVTRHQAVLKWIENQGIQVDQHLEHFHPDQAQGGDTLIGNLPIGMVAKLNQMGVSYLHIDINVPQAFRGQELTETQMQEFGASIVAYEVSEKQARL